MCYLLDTLIINLSNIVIQVLKTRDTIGWSRKGNTQRVLLYRFFFRLGYPLAYDI